MSNVRILEKELKENVMLAILTIDGNIQNPTPIMKKAIEQYTDEKYYAEFINIELDNPWTRLLIVSDNPKDIGDELDFVPYTLKNF